MGSHLGNRFLKLQQTRMHSSRMRTGRSLTVYWSLLRGSVCSGGGGVCSQGGGGGGVSAPGGLLQGVSALGGVCSGGVSAPGGCLLPRGVSAPRGWVEGMVWYPSMHWGRHTPPWTEWQTGAKILPWPQLRCGR